MKKTISIIVLVILTQACSMSEAIFELSPQQSMSITGKGVGQDAAYNPYDGEKSIAVVKNLGTSSFYVRIQLKGEIVENVEIKPKNTKQFILEEGYELYLDSQAKGKAKVTFKKFK